MAGWRDLLFEDKFRRSLTRRVAFRCWVAGWLCALALIIGPVERAAGQAAFLSIILVFVKPPAEPTIVFLAQTLLGSIAVAATWGWSVLAMKLSLLARDHEHDQRIANGTIASIRRQNPNATTPEIEGQLIVQVFEGAFLQAGPSAIYAVFLFIGIYFIFLIRAYRVRLFFLMVFCTVLLCIFATLGPLIPLFFGLELSQLYLIPHAYYLAASLFAILLIFPTSVAETITESLRHQTYSILSIIESVSPAKLTSTSAADFASISAGLQAQRVGLTEKFDLIDLIAPYLGAEISVGRASGRDVQSLRMSVRNVSLTLGGFSVLLRHLGDIISSPAVPDQTKSSSTPAPQLDLSFLSSPKLSTQHTAIQNALSSLFAFFEAQTDWTNRFPGLFLGRAKAREASVERAKSMQSALESLRGSFDDESSAAKQTDAGDAAYAHALYVESLTAISQNIMALLEVAIRVEKQEVRIWWPGKQNAVTLTLDGEKQPLHEKGNVVEGKNKQTQNEAGVWQAVLGGSGAVPDGEDDPEHIAGMPTATTTSSADSSEKGLEIPTPLPRPTTYKIHYALNWIGNTQSTFSFKVAVLAICLAVPAWIKANGSAKFYYENKGIWALVAGLTAKGVYNSETTFGFIQRLIGAVIGGVTALVMWYISTGTGSGNAYGLAAVCAVVLLYAMPHRIWHTNFLLTVTATTTAAIIIGYSWADVTVPVAFNPGYGYSVFWRRLVLVIIGLTASWIIDLLPHPKTGRKELRLTYHSTTLALGTIISETLTRVKYQPIQSSPSPSSQVIKHPRSTFDTIGPQVLSVHNKIRLSTVRILLAKLEPSLRKEWSAQHYLALQRLQFEILDLVGVMAFIAEEMDAQTRARVLTSDVFNGKQAVLLINLFYFASSALHSENPLPHHIPVPEEVLALANPNINLYLARITDPDTPRSFLILIGAYIELCQRADQLARQCQQMFGTALPHLL